MNPYRPLSSAAGSSSGAGGAANSPQTTGIQATSPVVSTSQTKPSPTTSTAVPTGTGLRPSYGLLTDREKERERERQIELSNRPFTYPGTSATPRPGDTLATPSSSSSSHTAPHHHHHHHHHHPSGAAGSGAVAAAAAGQTAQKPPTEQRNPYASTSQNTQTTASLNSPTFNYNFLRREPQRPTRLQWLPDFLRTPQQDREDEKYRKEMDQYKKDLDFYKRDKEQYFKEKIQRYKEEEERKGPERVESERYRIDRERLFMEKLAKQEKEKEARQQREKEARLQWEENRQRMEREARQREATNAAKPQDNSSAPARSDLFNLFGRTTADAQEMQRKERERIQREREQERNAMIQKEREARQREANAAERSPTSRMGQPGGAAKLNSNPYARPSLPPSPTASRTLPPPASSSSTGKPSISPQPPAASAAPATGATPRPNLPMPGFASFGARSLPSPFNGSDRPASTSVAPSPGAGSAQDAAGVSAHRRTPSGSAARAPDSATGQGGLNQTSPVLPSATQPGASSRSLLGGPPPLSAANRDREQPSTAARATTVASPRDRESIVSPTGTGPNKPATTSASSAAPTTAQPSQPSRSMYSPFASFSPIPSYPNTFGGFGLGGFGGYGAFGPRWEQQEEKRRRDREAIEQRDAREAREARARLEKEREERDQKWLKAQEQDRLNARYNEVFKPGRQPTTSAAASSSNPPPVRTGPDPYVDRQAANAAAAKYEKANQTRHIEVINQPESQAYPASTSAEPAGSGSASVMQQVAPQREPRPYGYKAESRTYQYTPRDKRPRMDAAVEDASAHRRSSAANKSKRRKEEDKKSPVVVLPKERDWAALTAMVKRYPEVSSSAVEQWLKTVPDLDRVVAQQVYTGGEWTMAKSGATVSRNEGGVVTVRIGGGFLGDGWKIRGESGWDEATCIPRGEVVCGAGDEHRKVWGTDVYTDDSDLGLVLVHAGWIRWTPSTSLNTRERDGDVINITVRVVPQLVRYTATERNGVISRGWGNGHDGASIVVEGVKRVKVSKKLVAKNRKARMAEWAMERKLVAPVLELLSEDERRLVHEVEDVGVVFAKNANGDSAGFKYTPNAVEGWLDPIDGEEKASRSLWAYDLHLSNGTSCGDRYILSLDERSTLDQPRLKLSKQSYSSKEQNQIDSVNETIIEDRPISDIHFMPEGLAVRVSGVKGVLCPVKLFKWVKVEREGKEWLLEDYGIEEKVVDDA